MDQVAYHLGIVIWRWCRAEPGSYGMGERLGDLWRRAYPTTPRYDPDGILALLPKIYSDPLFVICPAALNLTPGHFVTGGALQTVLDLYNHLRPCENPAFQYPRAT